MKLDTKDLSHLPTGEKQRILTDLLRTLKVHMSHGEFRACLMTAGWDDVLTEYETTKDLFTKALAERDEQIRKLAGRKRLLTDDQAEHARYLYNETSCSMQRVADHFGVSVGVIAHVINRTGAYKDA